MNEGDNGKEDIRRPCNHGAEYPQFQWRYAKGDIVCPDRVDSNDLDKLCNQWLYMLLPEEIDFHKDNVIDFLDWAIFANAWQSTASSPNWNPDCGVVPDGGDGKVDIQDMMAFCQSWLETGVYYLNADIAPSLADGIVNFLDYAAFADNWLEGI